MVILIKCLKYNFNRGFTNITEKISQSNKNNKNNGSVQSSYDMMQKMFMIPVFIGILFIFVNIIITFIFLFTKIRDDQRMGIKVLNSNKLLT